jgi:hypothetical protein
MTNWVESHGIEVILIYFAFAALVGSMPPLPPDASYWQRWAYGFLQLSSANLTRAAKLFNIKVPNGMGDKDGGS